MSNNQLQQSNEYELKIDAPVEKFVEMKQKLTYFLITASVAVIAFLANFVIKFPCEAKQFIWFVILSSVFGILTSGLSLLNLSAELRSYRLHLKYRYEKRNWASLNDAEKNEWNDVNNRASNFLKASFVCLFLEIALAVLFFILFFTSMRILRL